MANDESVIKRRLLMDGDGTGDDRRISVLLKSFIKWSNTKDTKENTQAAHDRMLGQLAQCEFTVKKSKYIRQMMDDELKNYGNISKAIDVAIEQAKEQIVQSKANLITAKKIRKNRMEYDLLSEVISRHPDRKETTAKLETLKREHEELIKELKELEHKIESRRDDFTVLMRAINELQRMDVNVDRNTDRNAEPIDNSDDDDDVAMIID